MSSKQCEHSDDLVALGAMRLLTPPEEMQLAERVQQCPSCQARLQEYQALAGAMPRLVKLESAPEKSPRALQPLPGINGKKPQGIAENPGDDAATHDPPGKGTLHSWSRRAAHPSHRLMSVVSGLAAVLLLTALISGFWVLANGRGHSPVRPAKQGCTSQVKNEQSAGWNCGILAIDYSNASGALTPLDPVTGKPLPGLEPLHVGNVISTATTADHHIMVIVVVPNQIEDATYLQLVSLAQWEIGPKITIGQYVQALAISDDGTHVYAVTTDEASRTPNARLYAYIVRIGQANVLQAAWNTPLPFAPDWGDFAISPDGSRLYAFTAQTSPAQVMQIRLRSNGIETPLIHPLNFANGVEPPFNESNTVNPNDPIVSVYHPAVMFSPDRSRLYLVYTPPAPESGHDRLLIVNLANWQFNTERDIIESGQALTESDQPASASSGASAPLRATLPSLGRDNAVPALAHNPQHALTPAKGVPFNGRDEWGVVSPDGRWLYLTGATSTGKVNLDGTWNEQVTYLGLWKVDVQTGEVVKHWYAGTAFYGMMLSGDGATVYLYEQPVIADAAIQQPSTLLALATKTDIITPRFNLPDTEQVDLVGCHDEIEG